jgi:predicted nuclease with TOPRIM domain
MEIIAYLLQPMIFFEIVAVLIVISTVVMFSLIRQERKYKELDGLLKKEIAAKEELENKHKDLQNELRNLRNELNTKDQMHEGLKGQYNELEKDFEKLTQELESVKGIQPKGETKSQESSPEPKDSPSHSITDLLRELKAIQNPPNIPQQ